MTLPASGAISFSNINTELCRSSTAQLSLNDSCLRTLFGQASGAVCMNTGHGKTNTSVPGIPTGVSASASSCSAISVSFSAPGCTGHLTIDSYQVVCTSSGTKSATGASSPISVTGLSSSTSYTFKVRAHNSKGYGCYSSSTGTASTSAAPYMCITTSGACVFTCGNYKVARWLATGSFTVNSLGSNSTYGRRMRWWMISGGGAGGATTAGGGGQIRHNLCVSYTNISQLIVHTYPVIVGAGGTGFGGGYTPYFSGDRSYICPTGTCSAPTPNTLASACSGNHYLGAGCNRCYRNNNVSGGAAYAGGTWSITGDKCGTDISGGGGGNNNSTGTNGIIYGYLLAPGKGAAGAAGDYVYCQECGRTSSIFGTGAACRIGGSYKPYAAGGGGMVYTNHNSRTLNFCGGAGSGGSPGCGGQGGAYNKGVVRYPGSAPAYSASGGGGGIPCVSAGGNGGSGQVMIKWRFQ